MIFLHIGTHKTGSTAIQETLLKNRFLLKKKNFYNVQEAALLPQRLMEIPNGNVSELEKEKKKLFCLINRHKKKDILFSSERFCGTLSKKFRDNCSIVE